MNSTLLKELVHDMQGGKVGNYIIPGLDSHLLENGTVRLFSQTIEQHGDITPHSHRFSLACYVVNGYVDNTLWHETIANHRNQRMRRTTMAYDGDIGQHTRKEAQDSHYRVETARYAMGMWYYMDSKAVHSIRFSHGAVVLLLEGPEVAENNVILEPYINGEVHETYKVEPWMFKKEGA